MKIRSLTQGAYSCLVEPDVDQKVTLSKHIINMFDNGLAIEKDDPPPKDLVPGRPERPILVNPDKLAHRGTGSATGRVALMHAIAHIEFNAINLAWDAIYRFRNMPDKYYSDWVKVAGDETRHFILVRDYLRQRNYDYGDFEAHDGLWHMAERTKHDPLVRMALVPRVLEARGLDVTPKMIEKFTQANDVQASSILEVIYKEEVLHVSIGSHWFKFICEKRNLSCQDTFIELFREYVGHSIRGEINYKARLNSGFSNEELVQLCNI